MTVESTTSQSGPYAGAATTGPFLVGFPFLDNTHLLVVRKDAAGLETTLAYPADFNAVGAGGQSGYVSTTVAVAVGQTLTIQRSVPFTQLLDYTLSDSFPAESHEMGLDKLTMLAQQLLLALNGTLRVPEKASSLPVFPAAAARANLLAGFDASGNPNAVAPASGSAAALAIQIANAASAAQGAGQVGFNSGNAYGAATVGGAINLINTVLNATVNAKSYGVVGDGVTDDTAGFAAWIAAINSNPAKSVTAVLPGGDYRVASATIAATPLLITRSNVEMVGRGKPTITVTGATVTAYLFGSVGRSDITYRTIKFVGNNAANAYANGVCLAFTNNSTADINDFRVKDCEFTNFKGDYWVYCEALGTKAIRKMFVHRCTFTSLTTNARGPANIAINSAFVLAAGNASSSTGFVRGVSIQDNEMDADYIKTGAQIFNYVQDFHVDRNDIRNAGLLEISNDCGAYAILVYGQGVNVGSRGRVTQNIITAPRSVGIYHASRFEGTVYADNEVNGQTDTTVVTLPKGGICINGGSRVSVRGGSITNCAAYGVWWTPPSDAAGDARILIDGVLIDGCLIAGVLLQSALQDSRNVKVRGCIISECLDGILLDLFTSATITGVYLSDNNIRSSVAASRGIVVRSSDASYKIAELHIQGGTIKTVASGIVANNITTGQVHIGGGISIAGPYSAYGLSVVGSTKLVIDGVKFSGQTTGFALRTASAQGTLRNISFSADCLTANLIENSGGEDLGRSTPTWVPTASGVMVQNILPVEAGAAASKYVNREFVYSSGWLPQRMTTGN